jgi:hypothetical protein
MCPNFAENNRAEVRALIDDQSKVAAMIRDLVRDDAPIQPQGLTFII